MSSSNKLVIAAFCGLALILLLLSSPLQQIYWATTAQLLEAKGVIRRDQYRLGDHSYKPVAIPASLQHKSPIA